MRDYMHFHPIYFDELVTLNPNVNAPRQRALRGITDDFDVALVASIGTGHLRERDEDEIEQQPIAHSNSPQKLPSAVPEPCWTSPKSRAAKLQEPATSSPGQTLGLDVSPPNS